MAVILDTYTKSGLPAAGTNGRLARVTDDVRGIWLDTGSVWFATNANVVNVKEFGALGNDSDDDGPEINAAIAAAIAAGGGTVYFPPGTYKTNEQILLSGSGVDLKIVGSGMDKSIIKRNWSGSGHALYLTRGSLLTDLTVDNAGYGENAIGIHATTVLERVQVQNVGAGGIAFVVEAGSHLCHLKDLHATGSVNRILKVTGQTNHLIIERLYAAATSTTEYAIEITDQVFGCQIIGGVIEYKGGFLKVHNGCVGIDLYGVYIESNTNGGNLDDIVVGLDSGDVCENFAMVNCQLFQSNQNNTGGGVRISSNCNGALLKGCHLRRLFPSGDGINADMVQLERTSNTACGGWSIEDCVFASSGSGSYNAINMMGSGSYQPKQIRITNCRIARSAGPRPGRINIVSGVDNVVVDQTDLDVYIGSAVTNGFYRGVTGTLSNGSISGAMGMNGDFQLEGNYVQGREISDPAAPDTDHARAYFKDNGSGKTQFVVLFSSGSVQVIATQP